MFNCNFDFRKLSLVAIVMVGVSCHAYAAATDPTGCSTENNIYINPELALCSTHVYNIGGTKNPEDEGQRQVMDDVVALKTTVITQQMFKQYEYMDSMIKRFKTQLEKAVLLTRLKAASGDSGTSNSSSSNGSSSSSYGGNNKSQYVDEADDCNKADIIETYDCIQANINRVIAALDAGNISDARKQLNADINIAKRTDSSSEKYFKEPSDCTKMTNKNSAVRDCANALRYALSNAKVEFNKYQSQGNRNSGGVTP